MWLTTLSTVVAIATGLFTLRDQIFPSSAGTAAASVSGYQLAVGNVCTELNQADNTAAVTNSNNAGNAGNADTATTMRDDLLNTFYPALRNSESLLTQFEALNVPHQQVSLERAAVNAWSHIVTGQRAFVERLDAAPNLRSLDAVNDTLPALDDALDADDQTRALDLTKLGAGHCTLTFAIPSSASPAKASGNALTPAANSSALPFSDSPQPVP